MNAAQIQGDVLQRLDELTADLPPEEQFAVVEVLIEDLCHRAEQLDETFADRNEAPENFQVKVPPNPHL